MQPLTAGITKANTGVDGIVWHILGQTYVPKQVSEHSFAWQEIIWRAAQRSLAVMCPACWCSPVDCWP